MVRSWRAVVGDGTNSGDSERRPGKKKKTGVRNWECGRWRCMKNGMERPSFSFFQAHW